MILKVATEGLLIPKDLLGGAEEVDCRQEGDRIVLVPISKQNGSEERREEQDGPKKLGSIYNLLGKNPVECGVPDASERHDFYIYGNPHGDES